MNSLKKVILISAGDPASISTEITIKAIENSKIIKNIRPIVISSSNLIEDCKKNINSNIKLNEIKDKVNFSDYKENNLNIIPINLFEEIIFGKPNTKYASFIKNSIIDCVRIKTNSIASAIVTNPINKEIMYQSGFNFQGHTDFLASLSQYKKIPVMMLVTNGLKTIPLTIHVPIKNIPKLITKSLIEHSINIAKESLISLFNISKPRILVTGLNPHAGESGHLGREEIEVIQPVLTEFQKQGMNLIGPLPADTLFSSSSLDKADAVLSMYHDQGLPVLKFKGFGKATNITLGLPIIRTSVDHGTALDKAGTGEVDIGCLYQAIATAKAMIKK